MDWDSGGGADVADAAFVVSYSHSAKALPSHYPLLSSGFLPHFIFSDLPNHNTPVSGISSSTRVRPPLCDLPNNASPSYVNTFSY